MLPRGPPYLVALVLQLLEEGTEHDGRLPAECRPLRVWPGMAPARSSSKAAQQWCGMRRDGNTPLLPA